MQINYTSYDIDTGILTICAGSTTFKVTNPAHAEMIRNKISAGGILTDIQRKWLDPYRSPTPMTDRAKVLITIKNCRDLVSKAKTKR